MAKKITITGTDLLQTVSDDWGGKNAGSTPITKYGTEIPAGAEWGMNRGEVERFLKEQFGTKAGAFHVDSGYLYVFATVADKEAWILEPDDQYVLDKVKLPEGGDTPSDSLVIYSVDNTQYYKKGAQSVNIKFKVRNIIDGEQSGDISVKLTNAQGVVLYQATRPVTDENDFYTIPLQGSQLKNIANASETVTLRVDRTGEVRYVTRNLSMFCIELGLELHSAYNFGVANPANISYVPTFTLPQGITNIRLVVDVYKSASQVFKHFETSSIVTNNRVVLPLDWSDLPFSGVYMAKAYLDMNNGMIQSEVVETPLFAIVSGEEDSTQLVAIEPIKDVTLYDEVTPRIAVYNNGETSAVIDIVLNGGTHTQLEVMTARVNTEYTLVAEQANNVLVVQIMEEGEPITGTSEEFTATGSFNWQTIGGYEQNLTAKGRSNNELPTPANWGGITTFNDFSWSEGGSCWKDGALHLTGGASAIVGITPFFSTTPYDQQRSIGGGILDTGRTLRIRFKVSNICSTAARLIECFDGNVGFFVTPETIYVKMGNSGEITTDPDNGPQATQNNRHFSPDEYIELCITVQPYWDESYRLTGHFATMYVNGQFAGEAILSNTSLSQESALPLTLRAVGCDLDVSQITYYEKCLDSFEVLQNFVMALGSLEEMKEAFEKNQCYTGNGTVNFNESFKYCCALSAKLPADAVEGSCNLIVNTHEFDPAVTDTDAYPTGQQELELFFFRNGDVDTSRSMKYVGVNTKDLRVRIQGTSTAMEYRKNMRYDCKGTVKVYRWSRELYEAGGSINPSDGWYYVEDKTKLAIFMRGDATTEKACTLLTTKTNYNESTATRNLPMARWIDDAMRYLATVRDGNNNLMFPQLLTPPQKADASGAVRQAIDGLPAIQFTHAVGSQDYRFTGKVDLITDKKNAGVFGFAKNGPYDTENPVEHPDYSIEFRNGNTDVCNFRCPSLLKAGKYMDASFTTRGQDCLEYRWPDLDAGDTYYGDAHLRADSAIQRLYDFVFNCHPDFIGYKSKNGVISATNSIITVLGENRTDNANYRRQKFYAEMGNYMVKDSITFNAFVTKVLLWTDQRAKNQFFTHYAGDEVVSAYTDDLNTAGETYEILRLLPYDIDTSLRGDNASRLRYDFTRLYDDADVYNDTVGVTTISDEFYPSQQAIANPQEFIANRVMGKRSALFELLDATCQSEYATYFALLAAGYLNVEALKKYCITDEAEAYNSVVYNADTEYKYIASGSSSDQKKAHGSAKEDLLWWLKGRMYFMGGENGAGDFIGSSIRATMCQDSVLTQAGVPLTMRIPAGANGITLSVKSRVRNYIGTKLGSTGALAKQYAADPTQYYDVTLVTQGIGNEDAGRFNIYGHLFFDDVADFSRMFIASITDWGGCTTLKTMKFGDNAEGFKNPALTDIMGSGNPVFGACELLDLRNCVAYAESNFVCFPAAKTILLEGCDSLDGMELPSTDNLQVLSLPKNIRTLRLKNKTKLATLTLEQGGDLTAVDCENISNTTAAAVLGVLEQIYNNQ